MLFYAGLGSAEWSEGEEPLSDGYVLKCFVKSSDCFYFWSFCSICSSLSANCAYLSFEALLL
jgi:hypothetical protein